MFQDAVPNAIGSVDLVGRPVPTGSEPLLAWHDLPSILLRRLGWIVGGLCAALITAALLVVLLPRTYTADTEIVVQPTDLKAVDGSVNQVSNQPDTSVALIETAARVITSRKVLEPVVEKLGLESDPEFARGPSSLRALLAETRQDLHLATVAPPSDPMEEALQGLEKHIGVRRSERTFVIDLAVKSEDPDKAARIANAIVDSFLAVQADARADASRRVSDALTSRLGELRDSVRRNEDAVQSFRVANNLVVANGQMMNEQQLSETSSQLLAAENRTADAKAKLDQLDAAARGQDPGAIPESLQSQTITALRSQLAQVSKQEADARATFGARHPQLVQIRSQVDAVRRALDGEVQRIRDAARGEYERARAAESNLRANLAHQQARGTQASAAQIRLRELERDAEASRSVYEAFLVRARETAEQERVDTLNAWVMSPAVPPTDHTFPPPNLVILAAALALGLALGTAAALLRERFDPRLWTPARAAAITGVPVLATLDAGHRRVKGPGRTASRGGHGIIRGHDDLLALAQTLVGGRPTSLGRTVLLVGSDGDDVSFAAERLAAAVVAEGHRATLVRFGAAAAPASMPHCLDGPQAAGAPMAVRLDLPEPVEPWQVPLLVERLKTSLSKLDGGLMIVACRRGALALPQLTHLADATVLVLTRARSTCEEARSLVQRLRTKAGGLRGSILIRRTA